MGLWAKITIGLIEFLFHILVFTARERSKQGSFKDESGQKGVESISNLRAQHFPSDIRPSISRMMW